MSMLKVMLQKLRSNKRQLYQVRHQKTYTVINTVQFDLEQLSSHFAMDRNIENMQNSNTQPIDLKKPSADAF